MKTGLFLGRFQPFHLGHLEIIKEAKKEVDYLIIIIGSAQYSRTKDNPFTQLERTEMIESTLNDLKVTDFTIVPVEDVNDDKIYVRHIEKSVPDFHVVYAATNKNTKELFEKAGYKAKTSERFKGIRSTDIRQMISDDQNWKELVPPQVVEVVDDIGGVERVKSIFGLD